MTARGNAERTGCIDNQPGPKKPKVVWAHKAPEHFIGSPGAAGGRLYAPSLAAFNTGAFHALSLARDAASRLAWSKTAPFIKRPTVCSPAVLGDLVVFGDGMHQTDDAILYCVHGPTGRSIWQFAMPGKLIHLEGGPTLDSDRVFFGAGDAGVFCVEMNTAVLDGKEMDLKAVGELMDQKWKELQDKYEKDRKKDPEFAVAPTDDTLPKPSPKLVWQMGKGAWHVDAPVLRIATRVVVSSAYLDDEKCGKRALICLRTADGTLKWEAPLELNPWAGATAAGELILVGCSSIRFDLAKVAGAKGEVVAANLADGQVPWRKAVPGGVLSPVAVAEGLGVFTATDGKVRAVEAATGKDRWTFDAGQPFFGGPAIAAGAVYVADVRGTVHALRLADGKKLWSLSLAADPAVQTAGMVFGSPILHEGRLYVGTCNIGGEAQNQPGVIACIADEATIAAELAASIVALDKPARRITIPCRIAPRKLPSLKEIYPIEVMATAPAGQKAHETVVTFVVKPTDVHKALEELGLKPGKPGKGALPPTGPEVRVFLSIPDASGGSRTVPIEKTIVDTTSGRLLPELRWFFTGSVMRQPDPDKPFLVYGADLGGTLISLFPVTDECVLQSNLAEEDGRLVKAETNKDLLPKEGTPCTIIIEVPPVSAGVPESPAPGGRGGLELGPLPAVVEAPAPASLEALAGPDELPLPLLDMSRRPAGPLALTRRPIALEPAAAPPTPPPPRPNPERAPIPPSPLRISLTVTVPSANLDRLPLPSWEPPRWQQARMGLADDPTREALERVLLARTPPARRAAPPMLRLTIPDPFASARDIRLDQPPPDADPPIRDGRLPERPALPPARP